MASNEKDFTNLIAVLLYEEVRQKLKVQQWDLFTKMLPANPGDYSRHDWNQFVDIVENKLPVSSATGVAKSVEQAIRKGIPPAAILSFNAEPLLAALINAYSRLYSKGKHSRIIDLVTHSVSGRKTSRIPYYFCHGLLPVPSDVKRRRIIQAVDKLVFSETSYLQLANTSFSWQSSNFLQLASTIPIVFIGVSFSDSNLRRWLSWVHSNRVNELDTAYQRKGASTHHYWLNAHKGSADEKRWIESSVAHLGVRLIWIEDWEQISEAMGKLLGL